MNFESVKSKLEKKYKIDYYFDLNQIDQYHHSELYTILKDVKQQQYEDNYKIVFYYFQPLKQTYEDCPPDLLENLQKVLSYYDIPNFFCLMITNDKLVSAHLEYIFRRHTRDEPTAIEHMILPMESV